MLPPRLSIARIVSNRRPLRPPNPTNQVLGPRPFTQSSPLLLVSRLTPRPELPYLYSSALSRLPQSASPIQYQSQLSRYFTTEKRERFKSETKLTLRYILLGNTIVVLFVLLGWLISIEFTERKYPTPSEWTFRSRNIYRTARLMQEAEKMPSGIIEWPQVGNNYCVLISRLEDALIDGKTLETAQDGEHRVYVVGIDGLGFTRSGLDLSTKSEEWRRGYHEALMGAARVAEHMDECVRDTTRNITFPKQLMIGPSNPRPKPVPYGAAAAPLEENCVEASEPPQTFYMKILTSTGFTSQQRLDAALAYADWLDFKGLGGSAEEMYDWGLDIAMGALPMGANNIVDVKTGIISSNATYISNNILKATTALAVHHAQNKDLSVALPILLSVLRARRQLSFPFVSDPPSEPASKLQTFISTIKSVVVFPPYPPAPPTGDEVPIRSLKAICEEAALMAHVGEILFASSKDDAKLPFKTSKSQGTSAQQQSGLSWTRDAVEIAESTLLSVGYLDLETKQTCSECLKTGMDNWSTMVRKMLRDQQEDLASKESVVDGQRSWFWGGRTTQEAAEDEGRWEQEMQVVDERMHKVQRLLDQENEERKMKEAGGVFGMLIS
ncbi:MAG: hypothetical protein Q9220_005149 [cf. Caloplaca sp. 1 TL-2023]